MITKKMIYHPLNAIFKA